MKVYLKLFSISFLLLFFIVICLPVFPIFYLSPQGYRRINTRIVSFMSGLFLKILGCRVDCTPGLKKLKTNYLVVSNHLSYLDVLVLASCFPGCYVTSREVREMSFLGTITDLAGCLYVERRSRANLSNEISDITRALDHGLNVVIFPEGTSTNGESILRFRQPLFQSAINARKKVLPISIRYRKINHSPLTTANRDQVFWYDDMTFPDHFMGLAGIDNLEVLVRASRPINATSAETCAVLSTLAHAEVSKTYKPLCNK